MGAPNSTYLGWARHPTRVEHTNTPVQSIDMGCKPSNLGFTGRYRYMGATWVLVW